MSSVTYNHQPGIDKTKGNIPLAGTSHIYTVTKLLWPKEIEEFLGTQLVGFTLHVCCGMSKLGDIRLDLYQPNIDIKASMDRLPFGNESFDTVLVDPPYNSKFQIMHDMLSELCRVARKRILFQHWFSPVDKLGQYKKNHKFILTGLYNWMPKTYFGRMQIVSIFDKIPPPIDKPKDEPTCPRCKEKLTYIKTRTIIPKGAYPPQEMIVHDYTCNICNINISFGSRDGNLF